MDVMEIFETMEYGPAPEAAAPALAWIKEHSPFGLFINNRWVKPASGQYLDSINPATSKPLAQVAAANSADVDAAVAAARAAFETWGKTPGHVHVAHRHQIRRDHRGSRPPSRCSQHCDGRSVPGRRGPRAPSRCEQNRLHRFHRRGTQHPPCHRRFRQKTLARTRRQIALH